MEDTTSNSPDQQRKTSPIPVYIALGFLLVFSIIFIIEFLDLSEPSGGTSDENLTEDIYMDIVMPLLEEANPENGAELVVSHGCNACHADDAPIYAPRHSALAEVADDRRPPMKAAAYIYESIIYPGAFVVEGYQNNMPRIYHGQIPPEELGDIIAYLLGDGFSS